MAKGIERLYKSEKRDTVRSLTEQKGGPVQGRETVFGMKNKGNGVFLLDDEGPPKSPPENINPSIIADTDPKPAKARTIQFADEEAEAASKTVF